jgi:formamidopyrimidine-DNA glycosylase
MPELPDITVYVEALSRRLVGRKLERVRLNHPFLLKTVEPGIDEVAGKEVVEVRRIAKRIAIGVETDLWLVIHLMLAGRLHWKPVGFKLSRGYGLAAIDVADGCVVLTEAGSKRRASLHIVRGDADLSMHNPGGLEVLTASVDELRKRLAAQGTNRAIKKVLTDPTIISGIGNAYSDEILHWAKMSPFAIAHRLQDDEVERLHLAILEVMHEWTQRLREQAGDDFPEKVTAFRKEMAVHGKFGEHCPVCGAPIQRIRYADKKETNYCPGCQTDGKLLADRVMSRLLKDDRPKHLRDLEDDED